MRVLRTTPGTACVLDTPVSGHDNCGDAGDGDGMMVGGAVAVVAR